MKLSRWIAAAGALLLTCSLPVFAAAAEEDWLIPAAAEAPAFTDTVGSWCEDEVSVLYQTGLMQGVSDTAFGTSNSLMPEHVVVVCARLYSLLTGGDGALPAPAEGEAWYQPGYDALAQALDYSGGADGLMANVHATKYPATRWMLVDLLSQTLEAAEVELPVLNELTVVPDNTAPAVVDLYRAGILTGSDSYGTFDAEGTLSRGQAAAILARLVDPSLRRTLTLTPYDLCGEVVGLAPDTVVLTAGTENVTAELFACQLCTSLHQWGGGSQAALQDAIRSWCYYSAPFQALAQELGVTLTPEEQAQVQQYGADTAGFLGLGSAYWQYRQTGVLLNSKLQMRYWEEDWKAGESRYHTKLEDVSESLLAQAEPAAALTGLDLAAVYGRLTASPFLRWNF